VFTAYPNLQPKTLNVKYSSLLLVGVAACAHQRPVVLAPVRMDAPAANSNTQQPVAPFETQRDDPFATTNRIDWPGPNSYRSSSGIPGPEYWQQRADYTITAALDTGTTQLDGSLRIRYTNNSPDTLRYVWLQVDQNLYRTGSKGSALFPADSRWGVRGFQGGYDLTDVRVGSTVVQPRINDTMMRIDLPAPLLPRGGAAIISMKFSFASQSMGPTEWGETARYTRSLSGIRAWPFTMMFGDGTRTHI
jgi:hypothetical protein